MRSLLVGAFLAFGFSANAATTEIQALDFLLGSWIAEESAGVPGAASKGATTFEKALDGRAVVRRNIAEYPPRDGRAAFRHEDLMVIYRGGRDGTVRARYFDSEGNAIDYTVSATSDGVVLLGDVTPNAPRFRLTYRRTTDDRVAGQFEIARPASPDAFQPYVTWTMRRAS